MIRPAVPSDRGSIWSILEPIIRAGETYAFDRDWSKKDALAYWMGPDKACFVAERDNEILGTYYLRCNAEGGGSHVCNCGYMVAEHAQGQGIARAMCEHSLQNGRQRGYIAMQFNFVVSTNVGAVRLWEKLGFAIVGRLPDAFEHPRRGYVDALVMSRGL